MNKAKSKRLLVSMSVYTVSFFIFFMSNYSIAMIYDKAITIRDMSHMEVFASTIVALKGVGPLQYLESGWGYGYAGNFNPIKRTVKIYPFAHTYNYRNALVVDQNVCNEERLSIRIPSAEDIEVLVCNHFPVSFLSGYPNINRFLYKNCFMNALNARYDLARKYPFEQRVDKYFSSQGSFDLYKTACCTTNVSQEIDSCLYQIVCPSCQVYTQSEGDKENNVKSDPKSNRAVMEEDIDYFFN